MLWTCCLAQDDKFQGLSALLEEEGLLDMDDRPGQSVFADELELRVNPEITGSTSNIFNANGRVPAYINGAANRILLNGADWRPLAQKVATAATQGRQVSIMHIGDSHIQADGATGVTRRLLQAKYGNSGRGLIAPLKVCGTNEPRDYTFTTRGSDRHAILLRKPWAVQPGITGIGFQPVNADAYEITVSTASQTFGSQPFNKLRIYHDGTPLQVDRVLGETGMPLSINHLQRHDGYLEVALDRPTATATVQMHTPAATAPVIAGVELLNGKAGVRLNSIGNNGATFSTYNALAGFAEGIAATAPDLIIISLGANEAFGRVTDSDFYRQIDQLVTSLRRQAPQAQFLLVTPMECQRATTTRTGRGRKKRTTRSYAVNQNVKRLRNVMARYATDHAIPLYDFYAVAGGDGASAKWLADKLMNTDRIHLTWDGYDLQGRLTFQALEKAITQNQ